MKAIFEADPNSFFTVYDEIIGEETVTNSEFLVINMLDNFRYLVRARTHSLKAHLQPVILRILKCLDPNKYELRKACHEYVKNTLRSILHRWADQVRVRVLRESVAGGLTSSSPSATAPTTL